jgi:hypothetical protein
VVCWSAGSGMLVGGLLVGGLLVGGLLVRSAGQWVVVCRSVSLLVGGSAGRRVSWLVGLLVGRSAGRSVCRSVSLLVGGR